MSDEPTRNPKTKVSSVLADAVVFQGRNLRKCASPHLWTRMPNIKPTQLLGSVQFFKKWNRGGGVPERSWKSNLRFGSPPSVSRRSTCYLFGFGSRKQSAGFGRSLWKIARSLARRVTHSPLCTVNWCTFFRAIGLKAPVNFHAQSNNALFNLFLCYSEIVSIFTCVDSEINICYILLIQFSKVVVIIDHRFLCLDSFHLLLSESPICFSYIRFLTISTWNFINAFVFKL